MSSASRRLHTSLA